MLRNCDEKNQQFHWRSVGFSGPLVAPAGLERALRRRLPHRVMWPGHARTVFSNDTHFDFAKAFVTKSGILFSLFSVSSLLNLSCLQKVWDLVAVSVFIVDSAFGPAPSFLGVTSWCSLGLLFKLQTVGRITVTLKQSRLRESSSTETKCFLPIAQWNRVAALTEGTQWIYFHFKQNKNPCPRLAIRTLTCASLLPFAVCKFSSLIKKKTSSACPHERSRTNLFFFLLTCVNPAECVTSESVTAVFSGMFERFFVPLRSYF